LRALCNAPSVKLVIVRKLEPGQELPTKSVGQRRQSLGRHGLQSPGRRAAQIQCIDLRAPRLEPDRLAIGDDSSRAWLVHQHAKLAQAPAQRAARVVWHIPE